MLDLLCRKLTRCPGSGTSELSREAIDVRGSALSATTKVWI